MCKLMESICNVHLFSIVLNSFGISVNKDANCLWRLATCEGSTEWYMSWNVLKPHLCEGGHTTQFAREWALFSFNIFNIAQCQSFSYFNYFRSDDDHHSDSLRWSLRFNSVGRNFSTLDFNGWVWAPGGLLGEFALRPPGQVLELGCHCLRLWHHTFV